MISTAPRPRGDRAFRVAIAAAGAFYLAIVALALLGAGNAFGDTGWIVLAAVTMLPVGIFAAVRAPLIFPFGAYLALLPFDALLQQSSGATLTRFVAIAAGFALLLRVLLLRTACHPPRGWFAWFALLLYVSASLLWTADLTTGQTVIQQVVGLFLMLTILALYPASEFEFKGVLVLILATGLGAALYAVHLYTSSSVSVVDNRLVLTTASGVALDPNYFGTSFVLPIAIAFAGAFYTRRVWMRVFCAAASLLFMCGVLVSGSRGAFVAIGMMFVYFVLRSKNRLQVSAVVAAAIGLSAFFPTVWQRFSKDPSANGSGSGRTYIWQTGMQSFGQHWFAGGGVGSFQSIYDTSLLSAGQRVFQGWSRPSHSIVFGTLTEYGVIGLVLVLAAWYQTFRQTRAIPNTSSYYGMRLASEAALIGLFSQAFFIDTMVIKYYWLAFAIPLMLVNVVARAPHGAAANQRPVAAPHAG